MTSPALRSLIFAVAAFAAASAAATGPRDAGALYAQHCASCHGPERLGGTGPALLPENLGRLTREQAQGVIRNGRAQTQMPAFSAKLSDEQIRQLVDLIYTPPAQEPRWGEAEIRASQVIHNKPGTLGDKPVFKADPLNLFVVVETGDHHATILDGDKFEPIFRFPTRFALHGGPKFTPDGRYVYFGSRDGWVSKFDIYNLKYIAEIRAGINMRNIAVSSDGRYVLAGNYLPHTLVVLDARDLSLLKIIPVVGDDGKSSRVSAVYDAEPRRSFVAALKDIPEVWEIPYSDKHEPIYRGLVHDYRMAEALAEKGPFPVRRIHLDDYLDDFFFDQSYEHLIGAARNGKNGQVVNLIVGRKIADVDLPGLPHLGSGITWDWHGTPVLATPNLKEGMVTVIDMKHWKTIKHIKTLGPGFFLRSHEDTPYAWVDSSFSPDKNVRDAIQIIDKEKLEIVKTLRPEPGHTAQHIEFTRDGKYALVSIPEMDGALVIYDAATFKEVKRIPMKRPLGKYNVYNKITRSEGTSH
ncbi:MAG TPA: cytochrome D1 domain-containing protein [Candidatus Methylomirabilis sp.]|nr:cytochrome D1 domain-containing protein [Candidatus Methylomirabilis sp.]